MIEWADVDHIKVLSQEDAALYIAFIEIDKTRNWRLPTRAELLATGEPPSLWQWWYEEVDVNLAPFQTKLRYVWPVRDIDDECTSTN